MLALLLGLGGKLLARPSALLGIAAAIGFVWLKVDHVREVRWLEKELVVIAQQRDAETGAKLEYKSALAEVTFNRDQLALEVRRQNEAIAALVTEAKARESAATVAAVRALRAGEKSADDLRAPTSTVPHGDAAMNSWLQERFK
jgi:hypothetical protein